MVDTGQWVGCWARHRREWMLTKTGFLGLQRPGETLMGSHLAQIATVTVGVVVLLIWSSTFDPQPDSPNSVSAPNQQATGQSHVRPEELVTLSGLLERRANFPR